MTYGKGFVKQNKSLREAKPQKKMQNQKKRKRNLKKNPWG